MPRYKEYNETRVIEKAMNEFWLNGYGSSSLSMLTERMKINKFTFYEAFESKENLLLRTMGHYFRNYFKPVLEQLRSDKNVLNFILKILEAKQNKIPGCYILTITAETGENIPGAVQILDDYLEQLENVLFEVADHYHPATAAHKKADIVQQLLALCTSVPMMYPISTTEDCIEYTRNMLRLINIKN